MCSSDLHGVSAHGATEPGHGNAPAASTAHGSTSNDAHGHGDAHGTNGDAAQGHAAPHGETAAHGHEHAPTPNHGNGKNGVAWNDPIVLVGITGVVSLLAANGLSRGGNGLRVIMMCEIPSNALLADQFLEHFDGFSIGSNDLTQLPLGLDRDSGLVADAFDERDPAVKKLLAMAIEGCKRHGKYVGICGQGPSDHPDLAQWLVEQIGRAHV